MDEVESRQILELLQKLAADVETRKAEQTHDRLFYNQFMETLKSDFEEIKEKGFHRCTRHSEQIKNDRARREELQESIDRTNERVDDINQTMMKWIKGIAGTLAIYILYQILPK